MGNCEDCTPLNRNKSPDFNFDMVEVINKTLDNNLSVLHVVNPGKLKKCARFFICQKGLTKASAS